MSEKEKSAQELLEGAYKLATPDDNVTYYRDFAKHYDREFVKGMGYDLPAIVAQAYLEISSDQDQPIADLGCGTGLIAVNLPSTATLDGFDISEDMLAAARRKNRYRELYRLDLTTPIPEEFPKYSAVLSSGTFTHGHLGPEALENALSLGLPNALFVISINAQHYRAHGFEALLERLKTRGRVDNLRLEERAIYSNGGADHSRDTALICSFRKR